MGKLLAVGAFFVVVAGTAGPSAARAEPFDAKLGLWEVTHTTQTQGAPPVDMGKLTPEQRARLEAMFKARQGGTTRTVRSCLTKERLDEEIFPSDKEDSNCTRTLIANTRTVREMKMECRGEHPMTGDVRFEALSRERVRGNADMTIGGGPRPMKVHSTMTARWLGSDCGNVK